MADSYDMTIYGKQPVKEALFSNHRVKRLILAREMPEKDRVIFERLAGQRKVPVECIPKSNIQAYSGPVLHQGIAAITEKYQYSGEKDLWHLIDQDLNPLLLILDQIQDPQNLGAILRTAEIVRVTAVILPDKGSAQINATVVKTSAGSVFHLNVHRTDKLMALMEQLKERGMTVIAFAPGKSEYIYRYKLDLPVVLVIGSEGYGVRRNLQKMADHILSIPQKGRTGSLNASTSAAIILFETLRQREFKSPGKGYNPINGM